jgi:hypothetical protein
MSEDPFAEWRRMKLEFEDNRDQGGCDCCITVIGRPIGRRRWWWTHYNGNVSGLCDVCCSHWRENAFWDPNMAPSSLQELP